jgi:hypothetical protein
MGLWLRVGKTMVDLFWLLKAGDAATSSFDHRLPTPTEAPGNRKRLAAWREDFHLPVNDRQCEGKITRIRKITAVIGRPGGWRAMHSAEGVQHQSWAFSLLQGTPRPQAPNQPASVTPAVTGVCASSFTLLLFVDDVLLGVERGGKRPSTGLDVPWAACVRVLVVVVARVCGQGV